MKKNLNIILSIIMIIVMLFLIKSISWKKNITDLNSKDGKIATKLDYKGLKNSVDIVYDEKNNLYIAFKNKIQFINPKGVSYDIIKDENFNITSIDYAKGNLYFVTKGKLYSYDTQSKKIKECINTIPNFGDYNESKITVNDKYLFLSIGATTNSGVVGPDNNWIKENPYGYDITPKDITLRGLNFGSEKTGAFVPYKTKNSKGQIICGHFPGNASVIVYDIEKGFAETFAWGIRNIKAMDFNTESRIFALIGGMEDRGLRPVKGDTDYIYEIKKGMWYGWPDYSGGDPINSPRFKGANDSTIPFVLDNHCSTNPPAPIYQHKGGVNTLDLLCIDKKGSLGEIDTIYFYDKKEKMIYSLSKNSVINEFLSLNSLSGVKNIKFSSNAMKILDENGNIFSIEENNKFGNSSDKKHIMYYSMIVMLCIVVILIYKGKK